MLRRLVAVLLCAVALAAAGCGGAAAPSNSRPDQDARLLLDFAPNAVHAGIYLAQQRAYDEAEGVRLRIQSPGASTDGIKALLGGQADLAIVDIHDLAIARARGRDVVGVMAIVQTPLAAVLAQPGITRPRDLQGRKAGVTGLPSDDARWRR
jgi:ABC-type nitrate/sulfonate/bicarbonate transport system substrate-binding protein